MSSVVVLSSSPRTFARSPTPVECSSPLPSPYSLVRSRAAEQPRKTSKTASIQRDGFSVTFTKARSLLETRTGAENVPIRSPNSTTSEIKTLSPKRFKSSAAIARNSSRSRSNVENEDPIHDEVAECVPVAFTEPLNTTGSLKRVKSTPTKGYSSKVVISKLQDKLTEESCKPRTTTTRHDPFELPNPSPPTTRQDLLRGREGDVPRARQALSPLNIDAVIPRRTDWTPVKDKTEMSTHGSPSISISRSFSADLIGKFGYNEDKAVVASASRHEIDTVPTKRRRIHTVQSNVQRSAGKIPLTNAKAPKKPKAPIKKALTITNLATSNYFGKKDEDDKSTILDQLWSTEPGTLEAGHAGIPVDTSKAKTARKQRASKKNIQRKTLVSPASAIKSLESQDALFGSASQLARDESPSLIRATPEAVKQSESHRLSSPVQTQGTDPISIDITTPRPSTGVARFTKTRGLWSAAGRDEDNALLHIDTFDIDSFDTPDLRQAFPGKDVLVQPSTSCDPSLDLSRKQSPVLHGASPHTSVSQSWDIGEVKLRTGPGLAVSLPQAQVRAHHTATRTESSGKHALALPADNVVPLAETAVAMPVKTARKRSTKKPAFAGLTTEKLQKQIAAYGFKPIKKREQMIAVLEKCWDQKHVSVEVATAAQAEPLTESMDDNLKHSDYLSTLHGLASRRLPKKKATELQEYGEQEPKPARKRASKIKVAKDKAPNIPRTVRKHKSKAILSTDKVVDIDDLNPVDGDILTEAAAISLAEAAIAKATARAGSLTKGKLSNFKKVERLSTLSYESILGFEALLAATKDTTTLVITPFIECNIDTQIELAITSYKAPPLTNHQKDPTWHEKILLYDPIVLEDLAAWLNTVGLAEIEEDREVSALEVREWCEQRGICCLWKGGWRGNKAMKE